MTLPGGPNDFKISSDPESWNPTNAGTQIDFGGSPYIISLPRRRRPADAARSSVHPVEVIETKQAGEPWDVSTALQDASNVPERPPIRVGALGPSALRDFIVNNVDETAGRFYGVCGRFTGISKRPKTSIEVFESDQSRERASYHPAIGSSRER